MHSFNDTRQRRNLLDFNGFAPIHFPLTSYSTDSRTNSKDEMKHTYGDTLFFNNLHLIPDPLKKNLADSVITGEEKKVPNMVETKETERPQRPDYYPTLAGITSFFSGVLNVMGAIFQKRTTSPTSQYYDCFEDYNDQQMAPSPWQSSNIEVQNKNERDLFNFATNNEVNANLEVEMSTDCRLAASHCEEKLNQVRLLLTNKNNRNEQPSKFRLNRPRKAFIEAGSVEESFEDAFTPEDVTCLADNTYIEYYSPCNHHNEEYIHAEAPKVKIERCVKEPTDIVYSLPAENNKKNDLNEQSVLNDSSFVNTEEVVSSCEEKLSKLKALLKSKGKKVVNNEPEATRQAPEITNPIPIPVHNSEKSEIHKDFPNETVFGNEINSTELHSSQDSDYFNEVTGKFFSSSLESEDSFQIVFSDSPPNCRRRIPSECDSEDSFIVFEESPESCYTSHDVFGEDIGEVIHSDFDSDIEEDSGITCKLAHNLSRTFGDLTDDSLYSQDVVDSVQVCNEVINDKVNEINVIQDEEREDKKCGLLLNERRKAEKRKLPPKKVTFSSQPPKVHVMRVWAFAARQARAGHWERHALDRERFKRRIADVEMAISWVFKRQHRTRIVFQRFRPWWNAERRRELAEKKEKEEKEKERKKEEESIAREVEDNTDIKTVSTVNKDVGTKENAIQNGTNELNIDCNGLAEDDQSMKCNGIIIYESSPNNGSGKSRDTENTEISKPLETVSDNNNYFEQYWDHSNFETNNSNNDELHNDSIVKTTGINESVKIATTDDKSNIIRDIQIKEASVDT
ncbi:uncharacterized protein LOC123870910 isoform X2 [Maniola jurtina]|uniref:uncharacterized protein LOC123870910 isoform X2 n=1 Tax=Maniola jurtina TaxID=191418 RepID=UPI001E6880B2|nr:uncharacterized protein LOC123870910 isoform X2 [Maniola jurtina]